MSATGGGGNFFFFLILSGLEGNNFKPGVEKKNYKVREFTVKGIDSKGINSQVMGKKTGDNQKHDDSFKAVKQ